MAPVTIPLNDLGRHNSPLLDELRSATGRVVDSGWYLLGKESAAFERNFAEYCGTRHTIGVANGTDAIELSLRAAGVVRGQSVITVANAGFYTTAAIQAIGATPIFVDVEPTTQLMSAETLAQALKRLTPAAIVVTHLYGRLAEMDEIVHLCKGRAVPLIEDCAQAHGASRAGKRAGSFGLAGCFSFYPTKNLGALGDAGAIVSSDDAFADRIRSLRQYGWHGKYQVAEVGGRNSRIDEIQAAVLNVKLPRLETWNKRRRTIACAYANGIKNSRVTCPPTSGDDFVAHLYVVQCPEREALRKHLAQKGIGSEIHYPIPDHMQSVLASGGSIHELPVTERLAPQILTLPNFPEMTDDECSTVIDAINTW